MLAFIFSAAIIKANLAVIIDVQEKRDQQHVEHQPDFKRGFNLTQLLMSTSSDNKKIQGFSDSLRK